MKVIEILLLFVEKKFACVPRKRLSCATQPQWRNSSTSQGCNGNSRRSRRSGQRRSCCTKITNTKHQQQTPTTNKHNSSNNNTTITITITNKQTNKQQQQQSLHILLLCLCLRACLSLSPSLSSLCASLNLFAARASAQPAAVCAEINRADAPAHPALGCSLV